MTWEVEYIPEAVKDLERVDHAQRVIVIKSIEKVRQNPLPDYEGGYGKPLGNHNDSKLAGFLKIKLKRMGLRVVYKAVREGHIMRIIVISVRDDDMVYKMAEKRISLRGL